MKKYFLAIVGPSLSLLLILGCEQKNPAASLKVADQLIQHFNKHDAAAIAQLYAENATYMIAGVPEPLRGRKAVEENYAAFFRAFPDMTTELTLATASGDHLFCEGVTRGTHTGPLATPEGDIQPTGRTLELKFAFVFKVNQEGLIAEDRTYFDSAVMMSQLGLDEPSEEASVRAAIAQAWRQLIEATKQGNAAAIASLFTEDAINMPSFNSTQKGRAELEAMIAGWYSAGTVDIINQKTTEVFVHGDMAYEFGTQELRTQPRNAGPATTKFRYVSVFKKQADGSWKWHRWFGQPER